MTWQNQEIARTSGDARKLKYSAPALRGSSLLRQGCARQDQLISTRRRRTEDATAPGNRHSSSLLREDGAEPHQPAGEAGFGPAAAGVPRVPAAGHRGAGINVAIALRWRRCSAATPRGTCPVLGPADGHGGIMCCGGGRGRACPQGLGRAQGLAGGSEYG